MRTWQDIYDTIKEDATVVGSICIGPGLMCVLGGLASDAGLDVEARLRDGKKVYTEEAIGFIVEHYPLTKDQCKTLFSTNDFYGRIEDRRVALIVKVQGFEAQEKENS